MHSWVGRRICEKRKSFFAFVFDQNEKKIWYQRLDLMLDQLSDLLLDLHSDLHSDLVLDHLSDCNYYLCWPEYAVNG